MTVSPLSEDIKRELDGASRIAGIGDIVMGRFASGLASEADFVAWMILGRGIRLLRAICGLTNAGHTVEPLAMMRSLCELDIDFAYIVARREDAAETSRRFRLFDNYRFLPDKDRHQAFRRALAEVGRMPSDEIVRSGKEIAERYKRVRPIYTSGTSHGWSGLSLADRAAETGRWFEVEVIMSIGNAAVHPSSESFYLDYDIVHFAGLQKRVVAQRDRDPAAAHWGAIFLSRITHATASLRGIDVGEYAAEYDEKATTQH